MQHAKRNSAVKYLKSLAVSTEPVAPNPVELSVSDQSFDSQVARDTEGTEPKEDGGSP